MNRISNDEVPDELYREDPAQYQYTMQGPPERKIFGFKESTFQRIVFWAAVVLFVIAPLILALKPELYSAPVQVIFAAGLSWAGYWLGMKKSEDDAVRMANDRWLPQAESVILSLMTLKSNVTRFSRKMRKACCSGYSDLPELKKEEFKAVKIKIVTDCEASSERLDNIGHQLDDAIADWNRFVIANCTGDECARIYEAQQQREWSLDQELREMDAAEKATEAQSEVKENGQPANV